MRLDLIGTFIEKEFPFDRCQPQCLSAIDGELLLSSRDTMHLCPVQYFEIKQTAAECAVELCTAPHGAVSGWVRYCPMTAGSRLERKLSLSKLQVEKCVVIREIIFRSRFAFLSLSYSPINFIHSYLYVQ